jgi:hypothetical protein
MDIAWNSPFKTFWARSSTKRGHPFNETTLSLHSATTWFTAAAIISPV